MGAALAISVGANVLQWLFSGRKVVRADYAGQPCDTLVYDKAEWDKISPGKSTIEPRAGNGSKVDPGPRESAVRLPRTSVRDPLPPADGVLSTFESGVISPAQALKELHKDKPEKHRLSEVGRLRMQANHPNYSPETRKHAKDRLKGMGLPVKGVSHKRKTK